MIRFSILALILFGASMFAEAGILGRRGGGSCGSGGCQTSTCGSVAEPVDNQLRGTLNDEAPVVVRKNFVAQVAAPAEACTTCNKVALAPANVVAAVDTRGLGVQVQSQSGYNSGCGSGSCGGGRMGIVGRLFRR